MTRYRQRTRKMLIRYLGDVGPAPLFEIAEDFGLPARTIKNYFRHFASDFRVTGRGPGARWSTVSQVTDRGDIRPKTSISERSVR